ncbi:MAG TPA: branched-chain amino acid ABC transporter permease [Trebonia sp.]|nr:branched-chain amino acid ABC transporter permease [Trebonia sp.]
MLGVLNAVTLSALLVMLASGLAMIFGLRGIMNFAHGSLYMLGAYLAYSLASPLGFWPSLVVVPAILAVAGVLLEFGIFRPLRRRRDLDLALITYGLSLVIGQVLISIYSGNTLPVQPPAGLTGTISLFGVQYPSYRLLIIGLGLGTVIALFAWLKWTRTGLFVRAVSHDSATSHMVGVDIRRVGLLVVCLSTALAGLAGVLAGPYIAVQPGMGDSIMISSLVIIAIGGLGSIGGSIVAAVLIGVVSSLGEQFIPSVSSLLPYILLIVVLARRPQGLGGARSA